MSRRNRAPVAPPPPTPRQLAARKAVASRDSKAAAAKAAATRRARAGLAPPPAPPALAALPPFTAGTAYATREQWLTAARVALAPRFEAFGRPLPERIRFSIGFTSKGIGKRIGEHWHPIASADATHEIFIRPDYAEPVAVLEILVHELCHAALPLGEKHGPRFKALASWLGLAGKMTATHAGPRLAGELAELAQALGPLPHAKLNLPAKRPARPTIKLAGFKCEPCGYLAKVPADIAAGKGAPICPVCTETMAG